MREKAEARSWGESLLECAVKPIGWELLDRGGVVVGRLASGFEGLDGMRCAFARVMAMVRWGRDRSEPEYVDRLKCESWEVVVPELVFEPEF